MSQLARLVSFSLLPIVLLTSSALAQGGKKPGPSGDDGTSGEAAPVKVNITGTPKGVDEAIKKNDDKIKKECEKLSGQIGADFHGAQGLTIAIFAEDPTDRIQQLVRMADSMVFDLAKDFGVDAVADLWAKRAGPFYMYHFKSKSSFTDACRGYLDKRHASHGLGKNLAGFQDVGGLILAFPSPLASDWELDNIESEIAHRIGQTFMTYVSRVGPRFPEPKPLATDGEAAADGPSTGEAPKPMKPGEKEPEIEQIEWLTEGMAMYSAIRFTGSNSMYCITNAKYAGGIAIADKNRDTAYRLICLEIAQGTEDKGKDFAQLTKTDLNALTFLDLAKSYSFIDWAMQPAHREKFVATFKGMRGQRSFATSLKRATGWTLSDLEDNWKKYVLEEYGGKKKKPTAPDPKAKDPKAKDPKKK
ncbi:MAG: hypothetical protein ACKVS6_08180 [Planctomycetota bacterium]